MYHGTVLCLVMIVRNESAVIARCLRAARPHIARWCIVDTGSTDDTMQQVRRELEGIPGELHQRPWVNFGHNRTESVALARAMVDEAEAATTWALLLDADHELVAEEFDEAALVAPSYTLLQYDSSLEYPNTRLLRLDREWECTGATHEYWPQDDQTELLTTLSIADHNDGGCRADKLERDKALLLAELGANPNNERAMFYLAQTLEGLRDENCAELYKLRAGMGGYADEAWMAQYRLGRQVAEREIARLDLGRKIGRPLLDVAQAHAPARLLAAYAQNPARAESLWQLARFYRLADRPQLGYLFAKLGKAIPKPERGLFVEHHAYEVGIDEELAICSYYAGDLLGGAAACERLAHVGNWHGAANAFWYAAPLDGERGSYDVPQELRTFDGVIYHCSNPSLCGAGFVNVRLVGYKQERGRVYESLYGDGKIRTRNAIGHAGHWHLLDDTLGAEWNHAARIVGLEDIRLAQWQGRVWFTATTCQTPHGEGYPQVVLGRLSADLARVEHVVPIQYGESIEKNWLLWPAVDRLRCIYAFSPMTVLDLDPETGAVLQLKQAEAWTHPGRFRGSAGPVQLPNGYWLAVVHDVSRQAEYNVYTHRFVAWRDQELVVTSPFLLEHRGIEYCAGLRVADDAVTLSYGVEDRAAHWLKLPISKVLTLLGI